MARLIEFLVGGEAIENINAYYLFLLLIHGDTANSKLECCADLVITGC